MLKRYEPYVIDGGYDEEHSIGYRENDNGEFIKYDDYLTEKQSDKEELKKKVEEIIEWMIKENDNQTLTVWDIIKKLKQIVGE